MKRKEKRPVGGPDHQYRHASGLLDQPRNFANGVGDYPGAATAWNTNDSVVYTWEAQDQ